MSDKTARVHTNISNRAKAKQALERKVVFKSVLDNPFHIQWPSVPMNVQNTILARVISMMDGVAAYHLDRQRESKKRKKVQKSADEDGRPFKRAKVGVHTAAGHSQDLPRSLPESADTITHASVVPNNVASPPEILRHLTFGINEVTKRLEAQAKTARRVVVVSNTESAGWVRDSELRHPIKLVLVCMSDVDPPILIGHIPNLVAACNSSIRGCGTSATVSAEAVKLIPLPKGAEFTLSESTGLRRVAVMAIDVNAPELSALAGLTDQLPTLTASWLTPSSAIPSSFLDRRLIPTHLKQLRTSSPKDMKAAKQQRVVGKLAAKDRRKKKKQMQQAKGPHPPIAVGSSEA